MGTSSASRILFWVWIVSSASCRRSASDQDPSVFRPARFRAAFPDARRSPLVAGRSCSVAAGLDGFGEPGFIIKFVSAGAGMMSEGTISQT
jgi:hypothetical protein